MTSVGALRTFGAPATLTLGVERQLFQTLNVAFGSNRAGQVDAIRWSSERDFAPQVYSVEIPQEK